MNEIPHCMRGIESPDSREVRREEAIRQFNLTSTMFSTRLGRIPTWVLLLPAKRVLLRALWRSCAYQAQIIGAFGKSFAKGINEEFPCQCPECVKEREEE